MGDLGIPISVLPATMFDNNIILITADEKNLWKNDNTPDIIRKFSWFQLWWKRLLSISFQTTRCALTHRRESKT